MAWGCGRSWWLGYAAGVPDGPKEQKHRRVPGGPGGPVNEADVPGWWRVVASKDSWWGSGAESDVPY